MPDTLRGRHVADCIITPLVVSRLVKEFSHLHKKDIIAIS